LIHCKFHKFVCVSHILIPLKVLSNPSGASIRQALGEEVTVPFLEVIHQIVKEIPEGDEFVDKFSLCHRAFVWGMGAGSR
jgi:hypothetical protein